MSTKDHITTLLDMEDVVLKNIEEDAREITIQIELAQKVQRCPSCGATTRRIHDYHNRTIRDLDLRGKRTTLQYRCSRYLCPECGKKFGEKCSFAGRYQRFTHRVTAKTIDLLRRRGSPKTVAEDVGISLSGVNRVLNALAVHKTGIVAFRRIQGKSGRRKVPVHRHRLSEPPRFGYSAQKNCGKYTKLSVFFPNRAEVKYAVMDMNRGFRDVARILFPNATIIIDRFHVVRFCTHSYPQISAATSSALVGCCSSTATNCLMRTGLPSTSCSASPISWRRVMR